MGGLGLWLADQRGHLFPWVPVCMGFGIAAWLAWRGEPTPAAYWTGFALALVGLALWRSRGLVAGPLGAALLAAALGFLAIGARSDRVAATVLAYPYHGPVEGRVVMIDRSQSDKLRITLDQVRMGRLSAARTPGLVRISLHGPPAEDPTLPGTRLRLKAYLAAPDGPVEPGGFDFRRMAWFRGLGAVGYSRDPPEILAPPDPGALRVFRLRMAISASVQQALPGEPGSFAAAILTGDRAGIGKNTVQALRDSNLAHLLAISGLHMGLLTGFVFVAVRFALALVPGVALRVPGKKIAALVALAAAAFYLALSGGNVATERAFVMVAVMLGAVLLDRRAISLRSVAIAAIAILLLQPESMAEPGFQMSFAATAVLVAGFAALRDRGVMRRMPGWVRPVAVLVVSSSLAGLATAPIAAAHFNRFADYGLLANLAAVPLMGTVVIPGAVVAAVLSPVGLQAPALWMMELGTRWILAVAHAVAGWPGAVTPVPQPAPWVLPLVALAGLVVVLLRGPTRLVGVLPMLAALWVWDGDSRPGLLIAADAGAVGLMGAEGRAVSHARGSGFAVQSWLESDGDPATQAEAATRPGFAGGKEVRLFRLGTVQGAHLKGKGATGRVPEACRQARLVVLAADYPGPAPTGCLVIDRKTLAATGPLAVTRRAPGWEVRATHPREPRRWSGTAGGRARQAGTRPDPVALVAMLNRELDRLSTMSLASVGAPSLPR